MNLKEFIRTYQDDKELVLKIVEEAIENDHLVLARDFYNYLKKVGDPIELIMQLSSPITTVKELLDIDEFHDELSDSFFELQEIDGEDTLEYMYDYRDDFENKLTSSEIIDFKTYKVTFVVNIIINYICYDIHVEYKGDIEEGE